MSCTNTTDVLVRAMSDCAPARFACPFVSRMVKTCLASSSAVSVTVRLRFSLARGIMDVIATYPPKYTNPGLLFDSKKSQQLGATKTKVQALFAHIRDE